MSMLSYIKSPLQFVNTFTALLLRQQQQQEEVERRRRSTSSEGQGQEQDKEKEEEEDKRGHSSSTDGEEEATALEGCPRGADCPFAHVSLADVPGAERALAILASEVCTYVDIGVETMYVSLEELPYLCINE